MWEMNVGFVEALAGSALVDMSATMSAEACLDLREELVVAMALSS